MDILDPQSDQEIREKLNRVAARAEAAPDALARSLLKSALDEADSDPDAIAQLLDGIPGGRLSERALAWNRAGPDAP